MLSRRTRVVLTMLVLAALTFVILDLRGGQGPLSGVRNVGANIMGAAENVAATVFSPITGARSWWSEMHDQASQIETLTAENEELRAAAVAAADDGARVKALNELLGIASVGQYRVVPAEVIAVGPSQDFSWTVTIDAGKSDGIEPDMTVMNGQGLVGRVLKTTSNTSTVVLLVDSSSAVGGRVAGSEEIGIVAGTGRQDSLSFQLLDPTADLKVSDALVTFGSKGGRPYAPGLPIGEVVEVGGTPGQLTRVATIRPYVDISTLTMVAVVTKPPRVDPRDSVLPRVGFADPSPAPVPLGAGESASSSPSPLASLETEKETAATLQPATPSPTPSPSR